MNSHYDFLDFPEISHTGKGLKIIWRVNSWKSENSPLLSFRDFLKNVILKWEFKNFWELSLVNGLNSFDFDWTI